MTQELVEVSEETLAALKSVSTATLTTRLLAAGYRNTFLYGLKPIDSDNVSFAGPAYTLRYIPAREDLDTVGAFEDRSHPQRVAIDSIPAGSVLVMDCRGQPRAAAGGDILFTRLAQRGGVAVVSDGSVRDVARIREIGIPVFTRGVSAMTNLALHHAVDIDVPIGCAEVAVYPGDIMVGDADGVVCIPRALAKEIAEASVEQERMEAWLAERIRAGAPVIGTYPPSPEVLDEYHAWLDSRE